MKKNRFGKYRKNSILFFILFICYRMGIAVENLPHPSGHDGQQLIQALKESDEQG